MRVFAFIMAMLILGMNAVPCADNIVVKDSDYQIKALSSTESSKTDDHHSYPDSCSPLCTCGCCSIVSMYSVVFLMDITNVQKSVNHFSEFAEAVISLSLPIWQPPQL